LSYRGYERRTREHRAEAAPATVPQSATVSIVPAADNEDRPSRLN
jgi:hypothetical protein